jgi:predicted Zn-dependent protease
MTALRCTFAALGWFIAGTAPAQAPAAAKPEAERASGVQQPGAQDIVLQALRDELDRSMHALSMPAIAGPYYLAYAALDIDHVHVTAAHGALALSERYEQRALEVDLRIGSYEQDSSLAGFGEQSTGSLPIDDDYAALRHGIWLVTDDAFKSAAEGFEKKKTQKASSSSSEPDPPDFAKEPPLNHLEPMVRPELTLERAASLVTEASRAFDELPEVQHGSVELTAMVLQRRFVSSEGSSVRTSAPLFRIDVVGHAQADDGMPLTSYASFLATEPDALPDVAALKSAVSDVARELASLRNAARGESYSGPVLFEGLAAAQLFKAVLGSSLSGTPPPSLIPAAFRDASELEDKLGKLVLPSAFSVVDDPSLTTLDGKPVIGGYAVDDEGVVARKVELIDKGVLRELLMSRTPRRHRALERAWPRPARRRGGSPLEPDRARERRPIEQGTTQEAGYGCQKSRRAVRPRDQATRRADGDGQPQLARVVFGARAGRHRAAGTAGRAAALPGRSRGASARAFTRADSDRGAARSARLVFTEHHGQRGRHALPRACPTGDAGDAVHAHGLAGLGQRAGCAARAARGQ